MMIKIENLPIEFQDFFLEELEHDEIKYERLDETIEILNPKDYEKAKILFKKLDKLYDELTNLEDEAFTTIKINTKKYFLFNAHDKKQVNLYKRYKETYIDKSLFKMIGYEDFDDFDIGLAWEIFYDGRFTGPMTTWYYVDYGFPAVLITSSEGDFYIDVDDLSHAFRELMVDEGTKHPNRIKNAIQDLANEFKLKVDEIDFEYEDISRRYNLARDDFYICIKRTKDTFTPFETEQSFNIPQIADYSIVFKKDTKDIAWRDCTHGYDDHDWLFIITKGPYKGMYLRHYASRWQGAPDYEATIFSEIDEDALIKQGWIF